MKRTKMLCFDMDGTIADFYGVTGWLDMGNNADTTPYEIANPLWDMIELVALLQKAKAIGYEIRIITWLWDGGSPDFNERTRQAKREWLAKYNFPFDHFHGIKYGTTKADSVRRYLDPNGTAILFDDSAKVRKGWTLGETVDPTQTNIIDFLKEIL